MPKDQESQVEPKYSASDWDLAKYARSFSVDQEANEQQLAQLERLYSFEIEGRTFLLPEGQSAELISHVLFTPMPNAPSHFLGLVNVRGNVLPLYSLASFVSDSSKLIEQTVLYALLIGDSVNGALIVIDGKPVPVDKTELQSGAALATTLLPLRNCIEGVYKNHGKECYMLNCDNMFHFLSTQDLA